MRISLTLEAQADLDRIFQYYGADDPAMAKRTVARLLQSISMLEQFPLLGRPGRVKETRELSVARMPYYVVYRFLDEYELEVFAIVHERRQFPPSSEE